MHYNWYFYSNSNNDCVDISNNKAFILNFTLYILFFIDSKVFPCAFLWI